MKRFLTIVIALLLAIPTHALAQEETDPGVTPDSILYGLDKAYEKLQLILARDEGSKAKLHLKFAAERIAEAKAMANKGRPEFVDTLARNYQKEIENAEAEIVKGEAKGKNMTQVKEIVAEATLKHMIVLQDVHDKVPDVAKPAIEKAMEVSKRGHVRASEALGRVPAVGKAADRGIPLPPQAERARAGRQGDGDRERGPPERATVPPETTPAPQQPTTTPPTTTPTTLPPVETPAHGGAPSGIPGRGSR